MAIRKCLSQELRSVDGEPLEVTLIPKAIELDEEIVVEAKALLNTGASAPAMSWPP